MAKPYGMICPITRACELLEPRWTIAILTELWSGSTRFNDLRRGIGNISPALLSKRLKEMEAKGLVERIDDPATGAVNYLRTPMAVELEPALDLLALWAQKHIEAEAAVDGANVSALMWKMRRYILADQLPDRRIVIQFRLDDEGLEYDTYWALINSGKEIEICTAIPGYDVDLYVEFCARSLAALLLGRSTVDREIDAGRLFLSGDAYLARTMSRWLYVTSHVRTGEVAMLAAESLSGDRRRRTA